MSTIEAKHIPALEHMLQDVQTVAMHWTTLTGATLDLAQSHVRLEHKVDRLEAKVDNLEVRFDRLEAKVDRLEVRFDKLEVRFDKLEANVDRRFGLVEDELRKQSALLERLVGWVERDERRD